MLDRGSMEESNSLFFFWYMSLEVAFHLIWQKSFTTWLFKIVIKLIKFTSLRVEIFVGEIMINYDSNYISLTDQISERIIKLQNADEQADFIIDSYKAFKRIEDEIDLSNDPEFVRFLKFCLKKLTKNSTSTESIKRLRSSFSRYVIL